MERLSIDEVIAHCNRKVIWWEKLIPREKFENRDINDSACREYWEHRQVAEWLEQLKSYKDAEEQGLLLGLPCKVGDVLEWVDALGEKHTDTVNCIYIEQGLNDIQIETLCCQIGANEIGKTVFVKEEAESALEKMKGEKYETD